MADVIPLSEGKSENVYNIDRGARSFFADLNSLSPVRSYFLRSENGYKIAFRPNSSEAILRAPSYSLLDETYQIPLEQNKVNLTVLESDLESYSKLKARLIKTTLVYGAIGAVACTAVFGTDVSFPYLLGAGAGALYLYLLGLRTDQIGSGYSVKTSLVPTLSTAQGIESNLVSSDSVSTLDNTPSIQNRIVQNLANARLAVPVILMLSLAVQNTIFSDQPITPFQSVRKEQFLGAAAGFLTYRLAVLVSEVVSEIRTEDLLGILPGSLAEGYRRLAGASSQQTVETAKDLVPLVIICGPRAAGRSTVFRRLLQGALPLRSVPFLVTDREFYEDQLSFGTVDRTSRYVLISREELGALRSAGELLYEGKEATVLGKSIEVAIRRSDLFESTNNAKRTAKKQTFVIEGSTDLLESLSKETALRLLPVWISLQTKEQFIDRAMAMVRQEVVRPSLVNEKRTELAKRSADEVSALVDEAAKDVSYYMRRAPIFQITVLNTGTDDELVNELDQLIATVL